MFDWATILEVNNDSGSLWLFAVRIYIVLPGYTVGFY